MRPAWWGKIFGSRKILDIQTRAKSGGGALIAPEKNGHPRCLLSTIVLSDASTLRRISDKLGQ